MEIFEVGKEYQVTLAGSIRTIRVEKIINGRNPRFENYGKPCDVQFTELVQGMVYVSRITELKKLMV